VRPVRYRLNLTIISQKDTFTGKIEIDLDIRKPLDTIWLNARDLTFDSARLTVGGRTLAAKVQTSGTEFAGFSAPSTIPAGPAQLRIEYHAAFNKNGSDGLFKLQDGGQWYVYTQFESIDARKAFPCFDEPNFKAPLQLTLHVNQPDAAVSNTPVQSETGEPDGRKKVVFAQTNPLPSYLLALGWDLSISWTRGRRARINAAADHHAQGQSRASQIRSGGDWTAAGGPRNSISGCRILTKSWTSYRSRFLAARWRMPD
jgi:alanyl aminopeptidase